METLKILLYIASCSLLSRITLSENIGHNNALIGILTESNLVPTVQSKLTNLSNQSHLYVLKSFQKELGLNDLMKKARFLRNNSSHLQGTVSFLDQIESAILQDVDLNGKKSFMSFDAYHCNLASISINENILNKVTRYDQEYLRAIKATVEYLDLKKIAIVATKYSLDIQFAQILFLKLLSLKGENTFHNKYEITDFPLSSREILKTLYEIQLHSFKAIIIIGNSETAEVIFKLASQYGMLGFEKVWITIEFNEKQRLKIMPLKLINLVANHDMKLKWNVTDMTNILEEVRKEIKSTNFSEIEDLSSFFTKFNFTCNNKGGLQVKSFHRNEDGKQIELFSWKESVGITISTTSTNELRLYKPGAFKQKINVVTIADKPFTSVAKQYETGIKEISCSEGIICEIPAVNNNKTYWNKTCCVGYSVDLLKLLENDLHFIPRVYIVEDGSYGSKTMGKWNGMIGDIYKGKADMAAAGLTITNLRLKDVQFTSPFMRAPLGILMSNKKDRMTFVNFTFLVYMTEQLLWCLLATFFVGIVIVYSYENARSFFAPRGQEFNDDKSYKYVWKESFTYFSGLTFQRDLGGKNPKRPGARITAVIFAFTMVIVMTAYTAVLTASNVRQEERDPFKGMRDERLTNPTTAFRFGTVSATSLATFFSQAPDPVFQRMNLFMKNYNVKTNKEGIQNVLDGRLEGFISEYPFLRHYVTKQRDCLLRAIDLNIAQINYGFALPKDSEWTEAVSNAMLWYQEDGILAKLNKRWLSGSCTNAQNKTILHESYSLQYFGGLYLILFATCVIVFFLLIIEYSLEKCRSRDVCCKWRRNEMDMNQRNEEEMKEKTTDIYQVCEASN